MNFIEIEAAVGSSVRFSLIGDNTGLPAGAQFTVTGPAGAASVNGNRIGMLAIWEGRALNAGQLAAIYMATRARFGV